MESFPLLLALKLLYIIIGTILLCSEVLGQQYGMLDFHSGRLVQSSSRPGNSQTNAETCY